MKKPEKTSKQNAMRVALNVSAPNNLLCKIVSRSDLASACKYCIPSPSNVSLNAQFKYRSEFNWYQ